MTDSTVLNMTRGATVASQRSEIKAPPAKQPGSGQTYSVGASSLGPQPVKNVKLKIDREKLKKASEE